MQQSLQGALSMKTFPLALLAVVLLSGVVPPAAADNDTSPDSPSGKANNTGINVRDRNGDMTMPTDQSSSKADMDVTARIRKALTGDSTLSTNAKNVKIITENGRVTLRGPVKNDMERKKVFSMAKQHAPGKTIVNDLEVTAP
jgi:osmotically-inducible protein OsmY